MAISTEKQRHPSKRAAAFMLAVLIAAYMMSYVDRQILSLVVGPIKSDLRLNDFEVGLLQGLAFSLFFCLAGLPIGWMVDRHNRKWLVIFGILGWTMMTALCGLSNSFGMLFLARIGVGIGEAVLSPAAYSMIADSFRPERLVRAMAIYSMAGTFGVGIAYLAGGAVIEAVTSFPWLSFGLKPWQSVFITVSVPGVLVAIAMMFVKEAPRDGGNEDVVPIKDSLTQLWARRSDYAPIYVCSIMLSTVAWGGLVWFPSHLNRVYALEPSSVGYILGAIFLVCAPVGMLLSTLLTEYLQRRGHADAPLRAVGMIALILLIGSYAFWADDFHVAIVFFVLVALGQASFYPGLVGALQLLTPPRMRGINSSIFILATNLGSLGVGSTVMGAMSDRFFQGRVDGLGMIVGLTSGACALIAFGVAVTSLARFRKVAATAGRAVSVATS